MEFHNVLNYNNLGVRAKIWKHLLKYITGNKDNST
jgi:hypothetical protein